MSQNLNYPFTGSGPVNICANHMLEEDDSENEDEAGSDAEMADVQAASPVI